MRRASIAPPIEVVPHVAPHLPALARPDWPPVAEDTFLFYTIAEWTERKSVEKTVEAYLRAFSPRDRVLLIIKSTPADRRQHGAAGGPAQEGTSSWALARVLARHRDPPPVRLITRDLADAEIAALHRRGDCFVSLARSEGFGLGSFDAAAHGNPVVITGFGGQLDYLSDSPYLVGFGLVSVHDPINFPSASPEQRWAEPDIDHGAALMREVFERPERARELCVPLASEIRRRSAPEVIAHSLQAAVERHRRAAGVRQAGSSGSTRVVS